MKRIVSLALALMLILSLSVTAFAADGDGTVTLTIQGNSPGHVYRAYQIFSGNINPETHEISNAEWGSGITATDVDGDGDVGEDILAILQADTHTIPNSNGATTTLAAEFANLTSAQKIVEDMNSWGSNKERIEYLAKFIYGYTDAAGVAVGGLLSGTYTESNTGNDAYQYTFTGLQPGYYLIVDAPDKGINSDDHTSYTNILMAISSSQTVSVKGDVPFVTKQVSAAQVNGYGEYISNQINLDNYFKLDGTLPGNYEDYTHYYYQFSDTLSAGLMVTPNPATDLSSIIADAYILHNDKTTTSLMDHKPAVAVTANTNTVTFTWDNLKAAGMPALKSDDHIVVVYKAKLNPDAVVVGKTGNINTVKLIYSNNPNGTQTGTTVPDVSRVYTFGMEVTKVDSVSQAPLTGAKFRIYHVHPATENTPEHPVFAVLDANNKIVNWVNETQAEAIDANVDDGLITTVTVSAEEATKGTFEVYGLKHGLDYYLRETESPEHYNMLDRDIKVHITKYEVGTDNAVTSVQYEVDKSTSTINDDDGIIMASVENKKGTTLPSTGGMGTTVMYVVGGILVLAAVVLLVTKKRMSDAE